MARLLKEDTYTLLKEDGYAILTEEAVYIPRHSGTVGVLIF